MGIIAWLLFTFIYVSGSLLTASMILIGWTGFGSKSPSKLADFFSVQIENQPVKGRFQNNSGKFSIGSK